METPGAAVPFADEEIASVESYRRRKETAVLTIMFTDIVGFTELTEARGEEHANRVRRLHDELIERTITRGGAGLVVKRIGDAFMAVFAEPSTAVERALEIQEGLAELEREGADAGAPRVRVGLDMGQVTVEDRVDVDVFGRHVNRASRVEGLAGGGQVFLSYTAFDSARGWLTGSAKGYEWTSHGRFRLRGVSGPVEVFEVFDPRRVRAMPPKGGDRVRSVPRAAFAAGFVLLGIAGTIGYLQLQRTEVYLTDYAIPLSFLDGDTEAVLDGMDGESSRLLLSDVRPGLHVLHYDVADAVRYYAELPVRRGDNRLRARWEESRLPTLYRYVGLGEEAVHVARTGSYVLYDFDSGNVRIERSATVRIEVSVGEDPVESGTLVSALSWSLDLDGTPVADESRVFRTAVDAPEETEERFDIYEDEHHAYWIEARIVRSFAHLELNAAFRR